MLFEFLINSISPNPLLKGKKYKEIITDWNAEIEYEINDILLVFMFARMYLPFKFILFMTQFMNPRSCRVCSMNGCEASTIFAIKAMMKQKPWTMQFYGLVSTTLIFGFQLRIFESPLLDASG